MGECMVDVLCFLPVRCGVHLEEKQRKEMIEHARRGTEKLKTEE